MKLVMTIDYDSGTVTCSGPTLHYCLEGESPEIVRTEFFMALEEAEAALEKSEAELRDKLKKLEDNYEILANKTYKNQREISTAFRTEHYLKPKMAAHQEQVAILDFKFRLNKFDISDFTRRIREEDHWKYEINYDMVVVRSLDDWYNEYLLENQ